jgi:hypothetical protein
VLAVALVLTTTTLPQPLELPTQVAAVEELDGEQDRPHRLVLAVQE